MRKLVRFGNNRLKERFPLQRTLCASHPLRRVDSRASNSHGAQKHAHDVKVYEFSGAFKARGGRCARASDHKIWTVFFGLFRIEITCEKKKTSIHFLFFFFLFETLGCLNEDLRDQKTNGGRERFFVVVVGCGREVRRYLFQTHSSEIESNGCEILVRSEYGDEKVD